MTKTILIDLDSTVADILTPWLTAHNKKAGETLGVEDIRHWDMHLCTASKSPEIYHILETPGFFRNLQPFPGAVEAVKSLSERYEVFLVSAAAYGPSASEKLDWVKEHLPFLGNKRTVLTHAKHLIKGDFFIDDSPANAIQYRKAHRDAGIMAIRFPYNKDCVAYNMFGGDYTDPAGAWEQMVRYIDDAVNEDTVLRGNFWDGVFTAAYVK